MSTYLFPLEIQKRLVKYLLTGRKHNFLAALILSHLCVRRFQACGHITRLLATSKSDAVVYHVLEPIQCSVRQHLSARSARTSVSSLRRLLLQLLRGLDYLHDRGWVHFDLSLDSVAVSILTAASTSWLMPQSPHRLRNDLKCVEWDVKPCSINQSFVYWTSAILLFHVHVRTYTI